MINLANRSAKKEILDNDGIAFADIEQNMRELNVINTWLGGHDITVKGIQQILQHCKKKQPVTISEKGKTNDVLIVKSVDASFMPTNCKLSSFMASGVKLYLLTWGENNVVKTNLKTEDRNIIYSIIYEILGFTTFNE